MTSARQVPQPLEIAFSLVAEGPAPPEIDSVELEHLARYVLEAEAAVGNWEVTVILVDDERLQALHRDFMGIDAPTDIMTFPLAESGMEPFGGELVISVDHAATQADAWGLAPADEIRFLVIHGLLHLLGWRDDSAASRQSMLERQRTLLHAWRAE